VLATEDGSRGVRGFVTAPLEAALKGLPQFMIDGAAATSVPASGSRARRW